jgi:hypothetical protein
MSVFALVKTAADHAHLGLLRPERCEGGHRTVYAGRREADVVMTSFWRRHPSLKQVHEPATSTACYKKEISSPSGRFRI